MVLETDVPLALSCDGEAPAPDETTARYSCRQLEEAVVPERFQEIVAVSVTMLDRAGNLGLDSTTLVLDRRPPRSARPARARPCTSWATR